MSERPNSSTTTDSQPRVLLIESETGETRFLADALQSAGLDVDVRDTQTAVIDLPTLRGYESVVLANVPAADLSHEPTQPGRRARMFSRTYRIRSGSGSRSSASATNRSWPTMSS